MPRLSINVLSFIHFFFPVLVFLFPVFLVSLLRVVLFYYFFSLFYPYVFVCYPYVARMYSYVTRMLPVCSRMYSYVIDVYLYVLVCDSYVVVCYSYVLVWCFSHDHWLGRRGCRRYLVSVTALTAHSPKFRWSSFLCIMSWLWRLRCRYYSPKASMSLT